MVKHSNGEGPRILFDPAVPTTPAPLHKTRREYTSAARNFLGYKATGISIGLTAWLHECDGFTLIIQAFGDLCVRVIRGAFVLPTNKRLQESAFRPVD
jgi:hypothetical protein